MNVQKCFAIISRALVRVFIAMSFCCKFPPVKRWSIFFFLPCSSHFFSSLLVHSMYVYNAPTQIYVSIFQAIIIRKYLYYLILIFPPKPSNALKAVAAAGSSGMIEKNWRCLYKFNFHPPRTNPLSCATRKSTNPDM